MVILGSVINDKPKWYFRCHWYFRGIDCDYPVGVDSNYLMIYDFLELLIISVNQLYKGHPRLSLDFVGLIFFVTFSMVNNVRKGFCENRIFKLTRKYIDDSDVGGLKNIDVGDVKLLTILGC